MLPEAGNYYHKHPEESNTSYIHSPVMAQIACWTSPATTVPAANVAAGQVPDNPKKLDVAGAVQLQSSQKNSSVSSHVLVVMVLRPALRHPSCPLKAWLSSTDKRCEHHANPDDAPSSLERSNARLCNFKCAMAEGALHVRLARRERHGPAG